MKKGDIYYVDLKTKIGSEQGGKRPVLIINAEAFNDKVIVASMTTSNKKKLPVHIELNEKDTGLKRRSLLLLEQIIPIKRNELTKKIGRVDSKKKWDEIEGALRISLGL